MNGSEHDCVVLDSVASQANRMEEVLLQAWNDGRIKLPVISVDFSAQFKDIGKITSRRFRRDSALDRARPH